MKIRPPEKADITVLLRNLFLRTEQELIKEISKKRMLGQVEYAEVIALERVQRILQNMVDTSWNYVPAMIEKIFYHSDKDATGYANARDITGTHSASQIAIMEQLANNLQGELMEMAGTAKKSVEKVFTIARLENDPYRKLALEEILRQEASGKPWIKSSQDLVKEMETNGITGFTDKAGRKWSMQAYGNMAVRTTARQAEVAALLTSDEYDLWQIVKVGTTCPVCAPLEGRVYSKSGANPDYPPLSIAFGKIDPSGSNDLSNTYLNIHPNCLHSLVKYTTIGKSAEQIQKDKDFSSIDKNPLSRDPRTKKQIAAYREKEKNRQQLLRDMKQHKEYRAILGNDVPKDFAKFRDLKYNDPKRWHLYEDYKKSVKKGMISPLSGVKNYVRLHDEIDAKMIEIETVQGTKITGQRKHFIERVIGTMKDPKTGRSRSGVTVEDIQDALKNPLDVRKIVTDAKGDRSQKYIGANATVSVNPDTGKLIQCNPTDSDIARRLNERNGKKVQTDRRTD